MASRIEAALRVATESVQATIADVAGASQSPTALLSATAAGAQATLAVALILEDMRRRWIIESRKLELPPAAEATDELGHVLPRESIDGLVGAASEAMAALGKDHPTYKRIAGALGAMGGVGLVVSDQPAPASTYRG